MPYVANARMYSVTPAARQAWASLFDWVFRRAGVEFPMFEFEPPAMLSDLWARPDLGCAMMCGLPYALRERRPTLLAAPIPVPARFGGRAVYFSDLAVRADAPFQSLEDTFGGICGYTLADSMSGCVAFRRHLLAFRTTARPRLYGSVVGELINARGVIKALAEKRIDVGPLDGYAHELIKHSDPAYAAQARVIATTALAPMPPLVATAPLGASQVERLREAFGSVASAGDLASVRGTLLLNGFALPVAADYAVFHSIREAAERYAGIW